LHIPYCDSKCNYCAFNSYVGRFDTRPAYLEALHRQLTHELERFEATPKSVETLFIGGGTPSTIPSELYASIFDLLRPYLANGAEITTEANPNSASTEWLRGMHDLGVNRVSFGVQSFDPDKLKILGRAHSPEQAKTAILSAYNLGIEHLSLDLIYNVHGDTKALLSSDIEQAFALPVDHISAYELTIESHTLFAETPDVRQMDDALAFFVADRITQGGFEHYEISNFGRYQSRHNLGYWHLKDYIGAGAGAVGFRGLTSDDMSRSDLSSVGLTPSSLTSDDMSRSDLSSVGLTPNTETAIRYYPPTDIDAYLHNPLKSTEEPLTPDDLLTERLFLGLRSRVGIDTALLTEPMRERAAMLVAEGKLLSQKNRYINPNFFLADELALFLLE
jgi:oxygen-independent coproporphyrinogen-3 oxidase